MATAHSDRHSLTCVLGPLPPPHPPPLLRCHLSGLSPDYSDSTSHRLCDVALKALQPLSAPSTLAFKRRATTSTRTMIALLFLLAVLGTSLLAVSHAQYAAQLYPSPLPAALPSTCTPLTASSGLVAQYGAQYVGQCAFSFSYNLYSTPYPNQDPAAQAYATSGFFFTSTSTMTIPTTYSLLDKTYPANNVAYNITGVVDLRAQNTFDWNTTCGGSGLTATIIGVTPAQSNNLTSSNDNWLLLQYPYLTLAGVSYNLNATYNANWLSASSTSTPSFRTSCSLMQVQVSALRLTQTGATYSAVKMLAPISSLIGEWYLGQTNFASIRVQPYVEGTSSATFATPQPYVAPTLTTVNIGFQAMSTSVGNMGLYSFTGVRAVLSPSYAS